MRVFIAALRRSPARWLLIPTTVLAAYGVNSLPIASTARWEMILIDVGAYSLLLASLGAIWAALEYQEVWGPVLEFVPPSMVSRGMSRVAPAIAIGVWLTAGWLVGVAGGLLGVAIGDSLIIGRPDLLYILVTGMMAPFGVGVGTLVGATFPRLVGPLVAGLGTYAGVGLLMYGQSSTAKLFPISEGVLTLGNSYKSWFHPLQILWLGIGAGTLLSVLNLVKSKRGWALASVGCVAAIGVAALLLTTSTVQAGGVDEVCHNTTPKVCGPSIASPSFSLVAGEVSAVSTLLDLGIEEVSIQVGSGSRVSIEGNTMAVAMSDLYSGVGEATLRRLLEPTDVAACEDRGANFLAAHAAAGAAGVVPEDRLGAIVGQLAQVFERSPDWLRANMQSFRNCEVTYAELDSLR